VARLSNEDPVGRECGYVGVGGGGRTTAVPCRAGIIARLPRRRSSTDCLYLARTWMFQSDDVANAAPPSPDGPRRHPIFYTHSPSPRDFFLTRRFRELTLFSVDLFIWKQSKHKCTMDMHKHRRTRPNSKAIGYITEGDGGLLAISLCTWLSCISVN